MCGIAGTIGKPEQTRKVIDKMVDVITHRGPDDKGIHIDKKFAFGMRRLSIIDLGGGHQPISNEDGTVTVVFNGEIYNHRELRPELISLGHIFKTESDTEGLVHLYEQYGKDMVKKLRGMFGFSIFDQKKNQLFIARDFFGIKPIYYRVKRTSVPFKDQTQKGQHTGKHGKGSIATQATAKNGGAAGTTLKKERLELVSYGSEIKSLLQDESYKPKVNDAAVRNYLSFQYNPLEETMFEDIYRLPPGHYMTVDLDTHEFKIEPYWHYHFNKNEWPSATEQDEENLAKEIKRVVEDSVEHHLISDVPVGSFLSGGVDSGIIVSTVQNLRKRDGQKPVSTFTIGFDHVSEHDEARQVSDSIKTDHTEVHIKFEEYFNELPRISWHFDEPVADPSAVALYFLAREARKKVKVVLSGEGADELFGGYNIYREPFDTSIVRKLPGFVKAILKPLTSLPLDLYGLNYVRRALKTVEERYIGNAYIFKPHEVEKMYKKGGAGKSGKPGTASEKGLTGASSSMPQMIDMKPYYNVVKGESDSRKMQYIDINFWLPGDILAKADKMTMAHSLELRVPFLDIEVSKISSRVPDSLKYKNGATKHILRKAFESILPKETAHRRKLGFPTPIKQWIKDKPEEVTRIIKENAYIKSTFNSDYVDQLISSHIAGRKDNARKIYALLMFALWYNIFIDKSLQIPHSWN